MRGDAAHGTVYITPGKEEAMSTTRLATVVGFGSTHFRVEVLEANNGTWFFRITEIRDGAGRKEQIGTMLEFVDSSDSPGKTCRPGAPGSS